MVSVAAKLAIPLHNPAVLLTVTVDGTTITGANPTTVTTKLVCVLFPLRSVAVTVTVVLPIGNTDPDAGTAVTVKLFKQLSVAVGKLKFTTAPAALVAFTAPATLVLMIIAPEVN